MTFNPNLPPERLLEYRRIAEKRRKAPVQKIKARREQARKIAHRAAHLLRERFQATRVVVFGLLLRETCFHEWSDIDLAVWGLKPEHTFCALAAVMDLDPAFEINLVDMNLCPPGCKR